MNTPTPTPRTDAAWSATFDGQQMSAGRTARALRECSQQLETELAALTAERDAARARAERAEAELAAERARLDWLQAQEVKRGLEITEGHDDPLPFLVLDEDGTTHWGDTYRAAIDAAMKEGAK